MKARRQKSRHIRGKMLILLDRGVTRPIKTEFVAQTWNIITSLPITVHTTFFTFLHVSLLKLSLSFTKMKSLFLEFMAGRHRKFILEIFLHDSAVKWPNAIWATMWGGRVSWLDWQNWRWLVQMTCMGNQGQLVSFMYLHKCYVKANKKNYYYLIDLKNGISTSLWLGRALKTQWFTHPALNFLIFGN